MSTKPTLELYVHTYRDTHSARLNNITTTDATDEELTRINTVLPESKILASVTNCSVYINDKLIDQFSSQDRNYQYLQQLPSDYHRQIVCITNLLSQYMNGHYNIVIYYNELAIKHIINQLIDIITWVKLKSGSSDYWDCIGTPQQPKPNGLQNFIKYLGYDLRKYNANRVLNPSAPFMEDLLMEVLPVIMNTSETIIIRGELYKIAKKHKEFETSYEINEQQKYRAFQNQLPAYKTALKIGDEQILLTLDGDKYKIDKVLQVEHHNRRERRVAKAKEISNRNKK